MRPFPAFWNVLVFIVLISGGGLLQINGRPSTIKQLTPETIQLNGITINSTNNNNTDADTDIADTSADVSATSSSTNGSDEVTLMYGYSPRLDASLNITLTTIRPANRTRGLHVADYAAMLRSSDIARINTLLGDHEMMYRHQKMAILTLESCHDLIIASNYSVPIKKSKWTDPKRQRVRRPMNQVLRCRNAAKKMYKTWNLPSGTLLLFLSKRERQAEFIRGKKTPISDKRTGGIVRNVMNPKLKHALFGLALFEGTQHALAYMSGTTPPPLTPTNWTLVHETRQEHRDPQWWYWSDHGTGDDSRAWSTKATNVWWWMLGGACFILTLVSYMAAMRPVRLVTASVHQQPFTATSRYVVTLPDNGDSYLTPDGRSLMVTGLPISLRPEDRFAVRSLQIAMGCAVAVIVHCSWELAVNLMMDFVDAQQLPMSFSHLATLVVSVACCSWTVTAGESFAEDMLRRLRHRSICDTTDNDSEASASLYIRPLQCGKCSTSLDLLRDGPLMAMSGPQKEAALAGSTSYRTFSCSKCSVDADEPMLHLRQLECADSPLSSCARCSTLTVDRQSLLCLYCALDHGHNHCHIEELEQRDNDHV